MAKTAKNKASKTDTTVKNEGLDFEGAFSSDEQSKETGVSFEEALSELETIVRDLEAGEMTLENSLAKFAQGVSLTKICLNKLNSAQIKMDKILQEENGELILKPFQMREGGAE